MRAECSWDQAAWLDDRVDGLLEGVATGITSGLAASDRAGMIVRGAVPRSMHASRRAASALSHAAGLALAAMTLVGCAGGSGGGGGTGGGLSANRPQDVNAGLNALANDNRPTPDELHKFIERAATDLEDLKAAQEERRRRLAQANLTPPPEPTPVATTPADPATAPDSSLAGLAGATPSDTKPEPAPAATAPAAQPSAQERVRALAAELRNAINQQVGDPESSVSSSLALAMLEMLSAQETGAGAPSLANLSERERQAVQSVRELIDALAKDPAAASDPSRVAQMLARSMDALASAQSVRVARAELCRKVEAFGRFTPFEFNTFLAGQAHRVIIYTEAANFAYRDLGAEGNMKNGDRWSVELGQELQLYTGDGSMLAWRKPEQSVVETSRNKRRDFFITQMVELPRTLTVGQYSLKVVLRDRVSGARAEAIIPIQIVADQALVRGEDR
ncbi:MAG: hypothetical protein K2Y21_06070 [Phycisphaerales bacterium]|nr:hypothetical protein [Phycisphaerales bacterium]